MLNLNTNYSLRNRSQAIQNKEVNFKGKKELDLFLSFAKENVDKFQKQPEKMLNEIVNSFKSRGYQINDRSSSSNPVYDILEDGKIKGLLTFENTFKSIGFINYDDIKGTPNRHCSVRPDIKYISNAIL